MVNKKKYFLKCVSEIIKKRPLGSGGLIKERTGGAGGGEEGKSIVLGTEKHKGWGVSRMERIAWGQIGGEHKCYEVQGEVHKREMEHTGERSVLENTCILIGCLT